MFLGGMFWFISQDLDNLDKPWFTHALGLITITFAFFWLLIPMVVVRLRIRRRKRQNMDRYQKWLADGGIATIRPRPAKKIRLEPVDPGEQAFFHEKGTLYVRGAGTHCYFTNRRIVFAGKGVDICISLADLKNTVVEPGGIVFEVTEARRCAFTFHNPLIAADAIGLAKNGRLG